jgi:sugar lactone lactonase YvrE
MEDRVSSSRGLVACVPGTRNSPPHRSDDQGRIYATNYEQNAVLRRLPDGTFETLVHDPRLLWPDTLSVASDGYLYFTANQLHRQARYNEGQDLRQKPYVLWRVPIDAGPVRLAR